jgi:hypothetical protein
MLLQRYESVRPYADTVWGPASWTALEADILSLPEKLDAHEFCLFKIYLALRARYLSCSACAIHFEKAIKAMPNDAVHRTRAGLLRWLCAVHNDVNKRKQREPLPESEILDILNAKAAVKAGATDPHRRQVGAPPGDASHDALSSPATMNAGSMREEPQPRTASSTILVPAAALAGILLLAALASAARMLYSSKKTPSARRAK